MSREPARVWCGARSPRRVRRSARVERLRLPSRAAQDAPRRLEGVVGVRAHRRDAPHRRVAPVHELAGQAVVARPAAPLAAPLPTTQPPGHAARAAGRRADGRRRRRVRGPRGRRQVVARRRRRRRHPHALVHCRREDAVAVEIPLLPRPPPADVEDPHARALDGPRAPPLLRGRAVSQRRRRLLVRLEQHLRVHRRECGR